MYLILFEVSWDGGAYLLYYLRKESQVWCVDASWDGGVFCTIYGSLWPLPMN